MATEQGQGLNRRNFMRAGLGTAVVAGVPLTAAGAAAAQGRGRGWGHGQGRGRGRGQQGRDCIQPGPFVVPRDRIGIQLYTVRDQFNQNQDPEGTLEALADIGYREIELAGTAGLSVVQLRRAVRHLGLRIVSSHEGIDRWRNDPEEMLANARFLGQKWVVIPYVGGNDRNWGQLAELLNEVGRMGRRYGVRAAYHNHDFEFQKDANGDFGFETLLEETDPAFVDFELDLYWAFEGMFAHGNHEAHPLELFVRAPGRFPLFHVKDGFPEQEGVDFADIGEGSIDFTQVFRAQRLSGVEHYLFENDAAPNDPAGSLDSAEDSYNNFVELYSNRRRGNGNGDDDDL